MTAPGRTARLGILALAMINVASIVSARNLPVMAEYGWAMLLLFLLSVLVFLVPISMVAAELGTSWPRDGGVYAWVKQAFGGRTGFLAVWCDYAENVAWFPTVLSFIAASLAYAIDPALATDERYLVAVMLVVFWATTAAALGGVRTSSLIGSIGTVAGSILPAVLVVVLGVVYLLRGNASQIPFSAGALVPRCRAGQPGVPGRDHPAVHRDGDGRVPRSRDARPRPHGPAGHLPRRHDHGGVLGPRLAVHGVRAAAAGDQPGVGDDGVVLQRAGPSRSDGCWHRWPWSWRWVASPI